MNSIFRTWGSRVFQSSLVRALSKIVIFAFPFLTAQIVATSIAKKNCIEELAKPTLTLLSEELAPVVREVAREQKLPLRVRPRFRPDSVAVWLVEVSNRSHRVSLTNMLYVLNQSFLNEDSIVFFGDKGSGGQILERFEELKKQYELRFGVQYPARHVVVLEYEPNELNQLKQKLLDTIGTLVHKYL